MSCCTTESLNHWATESLNRDDLKWRKKDLWFVWLSSIGLMEFLQSMAATGCRQVIRAKLESLDLWWSCSVVLVSPVAPTCSLKRQQNKSELVRATWPQTSRIRHSWRSESHDRSSGHEEKNTQPGRAETHCSNFLCLHRPIMLLC